MAAAPSAAVDQPDERAKPSPSGRLLLRMPAQLHAELARTAEREGTSLNQFITGTLAARIGWGDDHPPDPSPAPAADRARGVMLALVVNAVVIGMAAVAAIAILVLAWRG
jgi:HicB family